MLDLAGVQTAKKSKRKSKSALFIELDWHPLSPDKIPAVARWRGYSPKTVQWLTDNGLIGLNHGHVAIPIRNELGGVVRAQTRFEDGEWKYLPVNDAPITPLVIGDVRNAKIIHA